MSRYAKPKISAAILLLLILPVIGQAVSIQPAKIEVTYVPDQTTQYFFRIADYPSIQSYLAGELAPYATIFDPFNGTGAREISVTLKLPPEGVLESGRRVLYVGAREYAPASDGIGAFAAIQAPIYVQVPYPGLYLTMGMTFSDGDINSVIPVTISTTNQGKLIAEGVKAQLDVYRNGTGEKMFSLISQSRNLTPTADISFRFNVDTAGWAVGLYNLTSTLFYNGGQKERQGQLKLGTLGLKVRDFTSSFKPDAINLFGIEVENTGSIPLENIFGELKIGTRTVRTAPIDLLGWHTSNLTSYFDTEGMPEGAYEATATVIYAGRTAYLTKSVSLQKAAVAAPQIALPITITAGTSLAIGLVLVVIGLIFMIMRRRYAQV